METVIDKSIRDTLQIEPNKVNIQNPAWRQGLLDVVKKAAEGLGVPETMVRAKLYKLLLYEPNGFFKKHRDTEKEDGMFATLVIQLPSIFKGASFIVSHHGESQTFPLENGAANGCQFVAHYADCEHEIQPLTSGFRLALVYSLCYNGQKTEVPSAQNLNIGGFYLSRLFKNLPPSDSLFCIPLQHKYTSSSLSRIGVGALKGVDKYKQQMIATASSNWDFVIVELSRMDDEFGDKGNILIDKILDCEGNCGECHKQWMLDQLELYGLDDGGNILVRELDDEDFWQDLEYGEAFEYTEDEGATYETTYNTYALVAFSKSDFFERVCSSSFSDAMEQLQKDHSLLPRMMRFLRQRKPNISSNHCLDLLSLQTSDIGSTDKIRQSLDIILSCHCISTIPIPALTLELVNVVKTYGGFYTVTAPIRKLLNRYVKIHRKSDKYIFDCQKLLNVIEFYLLMSSSSPDANFLKRAVENVVTIFSQHTNKRHKEARDRSYSTYITENSNSTTNLGRKIVEMTKQFTWSKVKDTCIACFARLRKDCCKEYSLQLLLNRADAMKSLQVDDIPFSDLQDLLKEVALDFVKNIQLFLESVNKNTYKNSNHLSLSSTTANFDILCKILFKYADQATTDCIKLSVSKSSLQQVDVMLTLFRKVDVDESESVVMKKKLMELLEGYQKSLNIAKFKEKQKKLVADTRSGEPTFSFCMPNANTSSPLLNDFLASSFPGPKRIVVGNGIKYARSLANDPLQKGFSASITVDGKFNGKHASITIMKNRKLFESTLAKYRKDPKELENVEIELRKLEVESASQTKFASKNPRQNAQLSSNDNSSQKKRRRINH